ncbi:MAG: flagellin [Pseudomonadota bacterium]
MAVINTNVMSLNAQRNLSNTQNALATSMQRLSSGLRINSAKDDAAGLAITDRMSAQIRGLNQAVRNANDAISLTQTAEGAMQETTNILQRMRELSIQSANDTNSDGDRANIQKEVAQLKSEIDRIANTTTFNGKKILDGTFAGAKFHVGAFANESLSVYIGSTKATEMGAYTTSSNSNIGALSATTDADVNNVAADAATTISGQLGTKDISYSANATATEIAAKVNEVTGSTGVTATASTSVDLQFGAGVAANETVSFQLSSRDGSDNVQGSTVTISYLVTSTTDYKGLRDAINSVSADTGITAEVNSITNTLTLKNEQGHDIEIGSVAAGTADDVVFNVGATVTTVGGSFSSSATLQNDTTTAANLDTISVGGQVKFSSSKAFSITGADASFVTATSASATLSKVSAVNVSSQSGANDAINVIDEALKYVADARAGLGAIQNRMESTISNLRSVSENVAAARSRVQDADFAAETAAMTRAQILQQAGTAMLAQANSAPQSVLSLLQ